MATVSRSEDVVEGKMMTRIAGRIIYTVGFCCFTTVLVEEAIKGTHNWIGAGLSIFLVICGAFIMEIPNES